MKNLFTVLCMYQVFFLKTNVWSIVDFQCYISFRYTEKCINYTYTYVHPFLMIIFPYRLLQSIEQSSLGYKAGSCWSSMNHIFIHSSVNGHLGSFHVLAIINSAAVNTVVHVSFQITVSSRYTPSSGIDESYNSSIFSFLRNLCTQCLYQQAFLPTV